NAAIALPLATTALGGWLAAFLALVTQPEAPSAILDLLAHPLSLALWTEGPGATRAAVAHELARLAEPIPFLASAPRPPEVARYKAAVGKALAAFLAAPPAPLATWAKVFGELAQTLLGARLPGAARERALQLSAKESLAALAQELEHAGGLAHAPIS